MGPTAGGCAISSQAYYALAQKHKLSSIDDLLKPEYVHYCLESLPLHGETINRFLAARRLNALILRHYHTFPPLVAALHPHLVERVRPCSLLNSHRTQTHTRSRAPPLPEVLPLWLPRLPHPDQQEDPGLQAVSVLVHWGGFRALGAV